MAAKDEAKQPTAETKATKFKLDVRVHRITDEQRAKEELIAEKRREIREKSIQEREKREAEERLKKEAAREEKERKHRHRQELRDKEERLKTHKRERAERETRDIIARKEEEERAKRELRDARERERQERIKDKERERTEKRDAIRMKSAKSARSGKHVQYVNVTRPEQNRDTPTETSANHSAPPAVATEFDPTLKRRSTLIQHSGFNIAPSRTLPNKQHSNATSEDNDSTLLRLWDTMGLPFVADIKSAHLANAGNFRAVRDK